MYKIATWNIERPKSNSRKTQLVIDKIEIEDADILVLTETANSVNLSKIYPFRISTKSYDRTPDEQWVTIWSKWEIETQFETFDNFRTASGVIKTPFGNIIVFGTIIPYHMAGVNGIRYGNLNYKTWEYHEKDIIEQSRNWQQLIETEKLPLFVIGDFNQTRYRHIGYGTEKVRNLLTKELNKNNLTCITEVDFTENHLTEDPVKLKIRNNIDHICLSTELLETIDDLEVGAWNHFTINNEFMSDHNGVYMKFNKKIVG